ncbi:MAG TPA: hypothetical protein VIF82_16120 [Burkholderiaceae bacterium]
MKKIILLMSIVCITAYTIAADQAPSSTSPPAAPRLIEASTSNPIKVQIAVSSENIKSKETPFLGIPDVIWSAFIAGFIATITATITLRISNKHNRLIQLEDHRQETSEKERDRKHELRSEVYLDLANRSTTAISYYAKMALTDLDKVVDVEQHNLLLTALLKVVLVAEPETQAIANSLIPVCGKLYLTSLEWRLKNVAIDSQLKDQPTSTEYHQQKKDFPEQFAKVFYVEMTLFRKLQAKLFFEVKRELGINVELNELEQQFDKTAKDAFESLIEFIDHLKK